ncbi:MAG: hypothetical protein HDR97_06835 [Bacteroides sp.]|nr:hypothetical protein [Bacteroides sp.]
MNIRHLTLSVIVTVIAVLISGCSKRGNLLDTVPADVMAAGLMDLKKVCSDAGVEFGDKGVTVSRSLESRLGRQKLNLLDVAARLDHEGVADMSEVALMADGAHNGYLTFYISDFEKFKELCGTNVEWTGNRDGYQTATVPALGGCSLVAVKNQVWLTTANVKAVRALRESAESMPLSRINGVTQALNREGTLRLAIEKDFISRINGSERADKKSPADKNWLIVTASQGTEKTLEAQWQEIDPSGVTVKTPGMQRINPALLAYVPADFSLVGAMGVNGDFDWEPIEQTALMAGGFQGAAFMSIAAPYLRSIDGTVLLAARPKASADPDVMADYDFLLLARMPRQKIEALLNMVRTMLFTGGITPEWDASQGIMSFPQYGGMFYMGEVDGCLGISTIPFDNTRNNPLAPIFVNKDAAMSLDAGALFPSMSGLTLTMGMDAGHGLIKLSGTDATAGVLDYLLSVN